MELRNPFARKPAINADWWLEWVVYMHTQHKRIHGNMLEYQKLESEYQHYAMLLNYNNFLRKLAEDEGYKYLKAYIVSTDKSLQKMYRDICNRADKINAELSEAYAAYEVCLENLGIA